MQEEEEKILFRLVLIGQLNFFKLLIWDDGMYDFTPNHVIGLLLVICMKAQVGIYNLNIIGGKPPKRDSRSGP